MPASLAEALLAKYSNEAGNSDSDTKDGNCEFVIFAPRGGFHQCVPQTLIITSSEVSEAGNPDTLSEYLEAATELDISGNKLGQLDEIGTIFKNAPKLQILNLGFNDLSNTIIAQPLNFPVLESLRTLILVGTKAQWPLVWHFLLHVPNVETLHLSLNNYQLVSLNKCSCSGSKGTENGDGDCTGTCHSGKCGRSFSHVKTLMFDENPISSWEEVCKLGTAFPELTLLSLTNSPIKIIPNNAHSNFPSLKTLWMSNSLIENMEDLENLRYFPALNDLRISGMPYLKDFQEEKRRQMIIALLPNIEVLNRGRTITSDERETAERNFIRCYSDGENPPARFNELRSKHGNVEQFANVNFKPPVKVKLVIRHEEKEVARMAVNLKLSVKELKDLLGSVVGMHTSKMKLYYYDLVGNDQHVMKYSEKKLYTYNMQDNDEIIIIGI